MDFRGLWARRAILASKKSLWLLALLVLSFLVLGFLVRYSILQPFDVRASIELQESSGPPWDQLMLTATFFGSTLVVIPAAILLALLLEWKRHRRTAAFVLLTLLSVPLDVLLKSIWARERPDATLVHVMVNRVGFSFPSGHSLVGTAFYGGLAILCWVHLRDHGLRKPCVVILSAIPPLIAASRVYLGAHWLSDVIGGIAVGLILLVALTAWYRADKSEVAKPINPSPAVKA